MNYNNVGTRKTIWLSSILWSFDVRVRGQTWVVDTITTFFLTQFQRVVFLFLLPWNLIRLTWKRPLGLALVNVLLKQFKQKRVICYQLKPLVMESLRHPLMARMITYFSAISFNSLYIHAIGRPICESRESSFSVISSMEAVRWSYQSHQIRKKFNYLTSVIKTFLLPLST